MPKNSQYPSCDPSADWAQGTIIVIFALCLCFLFYCLIHAAEKVWAEYSGSAAPTKSCLLDAPDSRSRARVEGG